MKNWKALEEEAAKLLSWNPAITWRELLGDSFVQSATFKLVAVRELRAVRCH